MKFTSLLKTIIVAEDKASWTKQALAFLIQTSASIFYYYRVVVVVDEII